MRRLLLPLALLAAVIALALRSGQEPPRADFVFLNRGEVSTLDVPQMSWLQDFRVATLLYEGLTANDVFSREMRVVPAAAERWEVSQDGRTYTFHLRAGAAWSNGTPLTSGDFVFSWRRSMLPENGADYAKLFHLIRGGEAFTKWRADRLAAFAGRTDIPDRPAAARALWEETRRRFDETVGLRTPDARTLVVELERPVPYFLDLTSFVAFVPQYPPAIEAMERLDPATGAVRTGTDWTRPGNLVTNGPFVLASARFKRDMRLERNPRYWNPSAVGVDSIAIPAIADGNAQVIAFTTGAVDWTSDVTPPYRGEMLRRKEAFYAAHAAEVAALRSQGVDAVEIDRRLPPDPRANIHAFPSFGTYFYNFNCRERLADGRANPFADARVRRAFARAIDKRAIVDHVRRVGEPPARTLIPPGSIGGYESPEGLGFDPEEARRELAAAGHEGGKGLPTIELLFNREGEHDQIAQAVAKDWERHLGVSVRLVQKEVRVFREDVKSGRFMVSRGTWFGDYGDPTTFLDINRTGDGNNDRGYTSGAYDGLLARAAEETDASARMALLREAERLVVERDMPLVPLFQYSQLYLFDAHKVSGITPHPRQVQHLQFVDILGDGKGPDVPRVMRP